MIVFLITYVKSFLRRNTISIVIFLDMPGTPSKRLYENWEQALYYFLKRDLKLGVLLSDLGLSLSVSPPTPHGNPPPSQLDNALYHADPLTKSRSHPGLRLPAAGMASTWAGRLQRHRNLRPLLSPSSSRSTWDGQVFHHFVSWAELPCRPWPRVSSLSLLQHWPRGDATTGAQSRSFHKESLYPRHLLQPGRCSRKTTVRSLAHV